MVITQHRSRRKPTGGRYKQLYRSKRKFETGSNPTFSKIGKMVKRKVRTMGGSFKERFLLADSANVFNPKSKKYQKTAIKTVVENPANRHYVRRNILTRGTIIITELGKARITSRPGQEGTINAVLIEETK